MKKLAEEPWSWTLFEGGGKLLLEVVCGSVGLYTVTIELNESERAAWEADGVTSIGKLASRVSADPRAYQARGSSG